jgi:peptidoglycan/xylan/chitin deacetylase (PgdA/CDA1 family)
VEAIKERKDEFVAHGRTNAERQGTMEEAQEVALIKEVTETITKHLGSPPAGWMGPWVSQSAVTPDLLQEAGYQYLMDWGCDDQPIWLKTKKGRILSVPYARPTNDLPLMHGRNLTPREYVDILIDQFDEMLKQSQTQPLVFGLSLHPYLIGHAYALKQLRRCFQHITSHSDIWLASSGQIANHAANLPDGVVV